MNGALRPYARNDIGSDPLDSWQPMLDGHSLQLGQDALHAILHDEEVGTQPSVVKCHCCQSQHLGRSTGLGQGEHAVCWRRDAGFCTRFCPRAWARRHADWRDAGLVKRTMLQCRTQTYLECLAVCKVKGCVNAEGHNAWDDLRKQEHHKDNKIRSASGTHESSMCHAVTSTCTSSLCWHSSSNQCWELCRCCVLQFQTTS
jgi:hypothetical protein